MNDIPDCSKCERCKSMEYLFDDFYCCEENEPSQVYGLLGAYCLPEVSPMWCPKRVTDNGNIKQEDIGEHYGTDCQKMYSKFSVEFKNGEAIITLPSISDHKEERRCDYKVKGKEIYLTAEGETIKAFEIKGESLIVYEITSFDGNVVLKKK